MTIRFVSVVGGDTSLLGYSIEHYRSLGVESFHIVRQVEGEAEPGLSESIAVMRDHGLEFSQICVSPWHEDLNAQLIRAEMASAPHDWWVVADLDEFHVYDRPLAEVISYCEDNRRDYVSGAMLDRLAPDGELRDVAPYGGQSIWEQYPLAGLITFGVLRALPTKVTLARGTVELDYGQHRAWNGHPVRSDVLYPQVHHFKWTSSVQARLKKRAAAYSSGEWRLVNEDSDIIEQSTRVLRHIDQNSGRIDVTQPDFAIRPCGSRYSDYMIWDSVHMLWQEWYEQWDTERASTRH